MAAHLHRIETDCLQVEMTATLSSLALIPPPATPLPPQILIRLKNINSRRASFLATLSFYIQVKPVLLDQIFSWCKSARFGWFHWNSKEAQTCLLASVTLFWSAQRVCSTARCSSCRSRFTDHFPSTWSQRDLWPALLKAFTTQEGSSQNDPSLLVSSL